MRLIYKYYWIFQIVAFLLPLIGLPFPVVIFKIPDNGSYIIDGSITLWGTQSGIFPETFRINTFIFITSIICSLTVIVSSFTLPSISAHSIKKKEKLEKRILIIWIFIASLFVGILLFWTIMINNSIGVTMPPLLQDTNFWEFFTLGFGFFTLLTSAGCIYTGAFLYWKRRKEESLKRVEIPILKGEEKFEIKEDLEKNAFWTMFIFMIILTFWILITIAIFSHFIPNIPPLVYVLVLIFWGGFFYVLRKTVKYMQGSTKVRTLTITEHEIRFQFPNKPVFKINWEVFDKININERTENLPFVRRYGKGFKINYYIILFEGKSGLLSNFEMSAMEINYNKLISFIYKLNEFALKKNKQVIINSATIKIRLKRYISDS
ncbi:MAG: hypothetical protein ACFE8M_08715 [Candidatus Hermodarchaeota archaeon]